MDGSSRGFAQIGGDGMDIEAIREIEFPITKSYNFQNHAAVAPLSKRSADAGIEYFKHAHENAYLACDFWKRVERIRARFAKLIGAGEDEIAFTKNTSDGVSMVANGLNWNTGDNVVTTSVEFPANMYPWLALRARGVEVRTVLEEDGRIPLERIIEAIDNRTRVVAISSVQFASGFRTDLASLGEYCASKGVFLSVDGIQSLGALPIDVQGMQIDFLAADGHKWLCAPEGAGVFFVRKEIQGHLRPTSIGWASMKDAFNFSRYEFEFADSAKRYENGTHNIPGIFALGGALEIIEEVGIETISQRILMLTNRLVEGLRSKGYRIVSSRERGEASGVVAFVSDSHDHDKLRDHLEEEHRIVISVRSGRLRASPHFYNTEREIDQLVGCLPKH